MRNEFRTIVEAYSKLRNDFTSLLDACLTDADVLTLLHARYNFKDAGISLDRRLFSRAMSKAGTNVLGQAFDSHPQMNLTGHYRVYHNVKLPEAHGKAKIVNTAFYYASSEEFCMTAPILPSKKDEWEKAVLNSSQLTRDLLKSIRPCDNDGVGAALIIIKNNKINQSKKTPKRQPLANKTENMRIAPVHAALRIIEMLRLRIIEILRRIIRKSMPWMVRIKVF